MNPGAPARGFTYLGLLFLISLLAMTSVMASQLWSTQQRREREAELIYVGEQFQRAIERYAQATKGSDARHPQRLEALLRDDRVPEVRRHLRRLYVDPMTGSADWGLVRDANGGIVGIHSVSPLGPAPGTLNARRFASPAAPGQPARYLDWRFMASIAEAEPAAASAAASSPAKTD